MSEQAAKDLLERMNTDEAFLDKVMATADVRERHALVCAEGYDVTAEEMHELSDSLLDGVAAGLYVPGAYSPINNTQSQGSSSFFGS
jgi:predicted ribosomally synthesized peptide with nif11-like leader